MERSAPTTPQDGDTDKSPVLRRITNRIRRPKSTPASLETDVEQSEPSEDNDEFTPVPVDYSRRIARAEDRNATEIAKLEREQELVSKAESLPRYSYGWFLALLELECMATSERNADGKTISIRFGKVQKDLVSLPSPRSPASPTMGFQRNTANYMKWSGTPLSSTRRR